MADKKKENKKSGSKEKEKEKEKKPSKEELISTYKDLEIKLKNEKDETELYSNELNKELNLKLRLIESISNTNSKLSREIDYCTEQLEIRKREEEQKKQELQKSEREKKNENPLEIVIKVKDKEIEDTIGSLEKIKKEVSILKNELNDKKDDYELISSLENKILNEENKAANLLKELEFTNKFIVDDKQSTGNASNLFEIESKKNKTELEKLKKSLKELKNKSEEIKKEIESKRKTKNDIKRELLIYQDKNGMRQLEENLLKQKEEEKMNKIQYIEKEITKVKKQNDEEIKINTSLEKTLSPKKQRIRDKINEKESVNRSTIKNLSIKSNKIITSSKKSYILFSKEDENMFKNVVAKKTIETFQNRYNAICYSKESEENKHVLLVKTLQKTIKDIEEKHDINISNTKEYEQLARILSFQVDEFKGENKALTEKIQELIHIMNNLKNAISDKEIENKSIVSNIIELKAQYDKEISETLNPPEAQEENEEEEEENEEENEED